MVGVPSSCAPLGGFAIGARLSLLWQHSVERLEPEMSATACTRSMPGSKLQWFKCIWKSHFLPGARSWLIRIWTCCLPYVTILNACESCCRWWRAVALCFLYDAATPDEFELYLCRGSWLTRDCRLRYQPDACCYMHGMTPDCAILHSCVQTASLKLCFIHLHTCMSL